MYWRRQWETTPVKNFPRKITVERILSRSESSIALEEDMKTRSNDIKNKLQPDGC